MHAVAIRIEFRLPACSSLKEKRRRLRPILDHFRKRMELSVAEVDHHDAWQRSTIGVAIVAPQAGRLDALVERVRAWMLAHDDTELVEFEVTHLELP